MAIVPTAPERQRNGDNDHPYRHDSHFHYLTGFAEPGAWLLVDADGRTHALSAAPKDVEREIWDGYRLGPDARAGGARRRRGARRSPSSTRLMREQLANQPAVWFPFGVPPGCRRSIDGWLATHARRASAQRRRGAARAARPGPLLAEMRLVKDAGELATMRRAAAITRRRACARDALLRRALPRRDPQAGMPRIRDRGRAAARVPPPRRARPGLSARSSPPARTPACCTTPPATRRAARRRAVPDRRRLRARRLRERRHPHLPADGRFTPAQRELYDIVRGGAGRRASPPPGPARASATRTHAAVRVLAQGMLDTGLLDRDKVGDVDAVIESAAYRQFYMHGTGHWLGRDVHDVGDYHVADEAPVEQPDWIGGKVREEALARARSRAWCVTIEPGLYVRAGRGVPERYWNIGIRIEDDAVVTAQRLRADQPRRAGRGRRDRSADARLSPPPADARAAAALESAVPVFLIYAACAFARLRPRRLVDPIALPVAGHFAVTATTAAMLSTPPTPCPMRWPSLPGPDRRPLRQAALHPGLRRRSEADAAAGAFATAALPARDLGARRHLRRRLIPLVLAGPATPTHERERQVALGRMLFAIISGQMLGSFVSGFANVAFGWRSAPSSLRASRAVAAIVA